MADLTAKQLRAQMEKDSKKTVAKGKTPPDTDPESTKEEEVEEEVEVLKLREEIPLHVLNAHSRIGHIKRKQQELRRRIAMLVPSEALEDDED